MKPTITITQTTSIRYKSHLITFKAGYYWALGQGFKTLKAAKKEIDKMENCQL